VEPELLLLMIQLNVTSLIPASDEYVWYGQHCHVAVFEVQFVCTVTRSARNWYEPCGNGPVVPFAFCWSGDGLGDEALRRLLA
jgi:hypothetical protein